jgi:transcriptional regulator with XRE-family HTH domain
MKQNAIARLENPNYGEYSVRTLQRLAAAFDVALVVKFAPFSEVVRANQEATLADLTPAFFAEDKGLIDADVTYALSETINIINSPLSTNKDTYSHYQFSLLTGPVGPQTEIQPIVPHVAYVPAPSQTAWLN